VAQHYSDPKRETNSTSLPDIETFQARDAFGPNSDEYPDPEASPDSWWYWVCLPGCLPDSEPIGPFRTEAEAVEDARDGFDDYADDDDDDQEEVDNG